MSRRRLSRRSILCNALLACLSLKPGRSVNRALALRARILAAL